MTDMLYFTSTSPSTTSYSNDHSCFSVSNPFEDCLPVFLVASLPLQEKFHIEVYEVVQSSILIGVTSLKPEDLGNAEPERIYNKSIFVQAPEPHKNTKKANHGGCNFVNVTQGDHISILSTTKNELIFVLNGVEIAVISTASGIDYFPIIGMIGKRFAASIGQILSHGVRNPALELVKCNESLTVEEDGTLVTRVSDDFNEAYVLTSRGIDFFEVFSFKLIEVDNDRCGSLELGIILSDVNPVELGCSLNEISKVVARDSDVLSENNVVFENYFPISLDHVDTDTIFSIVVRTPNMVSFSLNGIDLGPVVVHQIQTRKVFYPFVKLYGKAIKIKLIDAHDVDEFVTRSPSGLENQHSVDSKVTEIHNDDIRHVEAENRAEDVKTKCIQTGLDSIEAGSALKLCPQKFSFTRNVHNSNSQTANMILFADSVAKTQPIVIRINRICRDVESSIAGGGLAIGICCFGSLEEMAIHSKSSTYISPHGVFHEGQLLRINSLEFKTFLTSFANLEVGGVLECAFFEGCVEISINNCTTWKLPHKIGLEKARLFVDMSYNVEEINLKLKDSTPRLLFRPSEMKPLAFHNRHGPNCLVEDKRRLTACRPEATSEFSDAILMSNRQLADNEIFEITIDSLVTLWSGSLEIGLTAQDPEKITFPKTMTQITKDIWMISGSAVVHNGDTIWNNYSYDFDKLVEGSTIGVMRSADGSMHVFLNGNDLGVACVDVPQGVYAIVDLYGQCNRVTILHPDQGPLNDYQFSSSSSYMSSTITPHQFLASANFELDHSLTVATIPSKQSNVKTSSSSLIVFSAQPIHPGVLFKIKVITNRKSINSNYNFKFGITNFDPSSIGSGIDMAELEKQYFSFYWSGSSVRLNGSVLKENYSPSLNTLIAPNAELCLVYSWDNKVSFAWNNTEFGQFDLKLDQISSNYNFDQLSDDNKPTGVYVFIDAAKTDIKSVKVLSSAIRKPLNNIALVPKKLVRTAKPVSVSNNAILETEEFSNCAIVNKLSFMQQPRGVNVEMSCENSIVSRTRSYNGAIVISKQVLIPNKAMMFSVQSVDHKLKNSFTLGLISSSDVAVARTKQTSSCCFNDISQLLNALICSISLDGVSHFGKVISDETVLRENWFQKGCSLGLLLTSQGQVHLVVNQKLCELLCSDVNYSCHLILDVNGCVTEVKLWDEFLDVSKIQKSRPYSIENLKDVGDKVARSNLSCEYVKLCTALKIALKLPKKFFLGESDKGVTCYCEWCMKKRGTETCFKQGEPLKPFTLPSGWCKFNLHLKSPTALLPDKSTWNIAYHCPHWKNLRTFFDNAQIFPPEKTKLRSTFSPSFKPVDEKLGDKFENTILLSPTVKYCSQDTFCPSMKFHNPDRSKILNGKIALQVWVKPNCYSSTAPSVDPSQVYDEEIPLGEHEWLTKETNVTFISALLIKVE